MKTENERACEIMETLLAHEPIIDVPYETINDIAVALVKEGYGDISEYKAEIEQLKDDYAKLQEQFAQYQMASDKEIKAQIKQAQIDVLKKLKERAIGYTFLGEKLATETDIDRLIEEVENEN